MPENTPKKTRRKKSTSSKTKKTTDEGYPDQNIPGLIPAMNGLADQLPEEFRVPAKLIIGANPVTRTVVSRTEKARLHEDVAGFVATTSTTNTINIKIS